MSIRGSFGGKPPVLVRSPPLLIPQNCLESARITPYNLQDLARPARSCPRNRAQLMYIWGGLGGKTSVRIHCPALLTPWKPTQTREALVCPISGRLRGGGTQHHEQGLLPGTINVYLRGSWWQTPCPYTFPASLDFPGLFGECLDNPPQSARRC